MSDNYFQRLIENNEMFEYQEEVEKEIGQASDRGIALICGSVIDEMLRELIKAVLIDTDKIDGELFRGNNALSTFESKKKMAFYFGLISKNEMDNITYLQRVRNKFAHQIIDVSFDNQDIINICHNFSIPENTFIPNLIPLQKYKSEDIPVIDLNPIKKDTSAKEKFILIFKHLFSQISMRMISDVVEKELNLKELKLLMLL